MPTCLSPLLAKLSTRRRAASDPHDEPAKPVMPVWPQRHEEEEKKGECLGRHGPVSQINLRSHSVSSQAHQLGFD